MKRSTLSLMLLPLMAAGLAYAGVARADEPAPAGKRSLIGTRCEADIAKFCAGIEAGGGKLAKCLHGHQEELLPECKGALGKGGWKLHHGPEGAGPAPGAAMPAAPGAPVAAGGPAPGAPGAAPAMPGEGGHHHGAGEEHRGGHGHEKADGPMKEMHEACMPDIEKFCKTVKAGRGRIATCLTQHTSELSATCKPKAEEMVARMANMGAGGAPAPGMHEHGKRGMGPHHMGMGMGGAPGTAAPAPTPAAPAPAAAAPAKTMAPAPAAH